LTNEVQATLSRAKRYNNIDGTDEIGFGVSILAAFVFGRVQAVLPPALFRGLWSGMLLLEVVMVGWCLLVWLGMRLIKRYLTFPRTGYVAIQRPALRTAGPMLAATCGVAAIGAAAVAAWAMHPSQFAGRLAPIALFLGCYLFFTVRMSPEHPWKRYVAGAMALAMVTTAAMLGGGSNWNLLRVMLGIWAVVWIGSGLATLWLYIRRTQPAAEGAE
jgi:hypothetical protein